MLQHEKKHKTGSYRCFECVQEFNSRSDLDNHNRENHRKTNVCSPVKSLDCKFCSKTFTRKEHVRRHLITVHQKIKSLLEYKLETENSFYCPECNFKSENDETSFISHLENHSKKEIPSISCSQCSKKFTRQDHLNRHLATVHSESREFTCEICLKAFKIIQDLKIHVRKVHNRVDEISCPECNRIFTHKSSLREHILVVHEKKKKFKCLVAGCKSEFSKRSRLKYHMDAMHVLKVFLCDLCGSDFSQKFKLRSHLMSHIKEKYKNLLSDQKIVINPLGELPKSEEKFIENTFVEPETKDEIEFEDSQNLTSPPIQDVLEFLKLPESSSEHSKFYCELCHKNYSSRAGLKVHKKNRHPLEYQSELSENRTIRGLKVNGSLTCDYCGQILKTKATLMIHFKKHLKFLRNEQFVCQFCGKSFNHFSSFQLHSKSHTRDYKKSCQYCSKKFLTNQTLKWHVDYHHLNKPAIPKEACQICQKKVQKFYLKIHLKSHSETFKCSICGRACITESSLKCHQFQHTKERPFSCLYCEKSYTYGKNLKFHVRKCHLHVAGIASFLASVNQMGNGKL